MLMEDPMHYPKIKSWADDWGGAVDYVDYVNANGDLALLVALSRIFWPRFVEVDGCVLWDRGFEESNFRQWQQNLAGKAPEIETMLNQIRVWQLVDSDDVKDDRDALHVVATRISRTWEAALLARFPDRLFDVRVITSEDGPIVTFSSGLRQ